MCDNADFIPEAAYRILRTVPGGRQTLSLRRLLGCSLARLVWPLMETRSQWAVEVAERFARGGESLLELMYAHAVANEVVRGWERVSWERDISLEEEAQFHAAWAAWAVTNLRPWKPVNSGLQAVVNVMLCQGKGPAQIEAVLCQTLGDALAVSFSGS